MYHNGSKHEIYKYSRELDYDLVLIPPYFHKWTVTTSSDILTTSSFRVEKINFRRYNLPPKLC